MAIETITSFDFSDPGKVRLMIGSGLYHQFDYTGPVMATKSDLDAIEARIMAKIASMGAATSPAASVGLYHDSPRNRAELNMGTNADSRRDDGIIDKLNTAQIYSEDLVRG